jgi:hypothetical protein
MQPQARTGRVELKVKGGGLSGLLLLAGQPGKAVGEGVRDAEFHNANFSFLYQIPLVKRVQLV